MDDDRIDLSSLDPTTDRERWDRLVSSTVTRALAAHRRRASVVQQLAAWRRPALALAAALAIVVWGAARFSGKTGPRAPAAREDPALTVARWAMSDEVPATPDVLAVCGRRP